jgi:cytochrome c oxidase subunit 3
MTRRIVADLSGLPDSGFGSRTPIWWGVAGFMLIEGGGFVLAIGAYFFLLGHTNPWPPNKLPPALLWGSLFTLIALLSELPNVWTKRVAHACKERQTQIGLVIMSLVGLLLVAVRFVEFGALNTRWDTGAYGSIVWALILLHTTHVITDLADTLVLTVFTFTHEVDVNRFSDVTDNCNYWHFVVLAWLPIYAIIYWTPRVLG